MNTSALAAAILISGPDAAPAAAEMLPLPAPVEASVAAAPQAAPSPAPAARDISADPAFDPAGDPSVDPSDDPAAAAGASPDPANVSGPQDQPGRAGTEDGPDSAIVVTARTPVPGDPIESVNVASFEAVQAVDDAVVAPVAHGYEKAVPGPVRKGLHNVLNNLDEPIVFLNFLLQLKPGKAAETLARFAINSTVGIGGVIDVAKRKPINLPRRSNGLADTLGYYGVGPGPYLFLPLIGSTTVRDMFGRVADLSLVPTAVGKPFTDPVFATTKGALSSLDERVENDAVLAEIKASADPYAAMRSYYLKKRKAEIDVLKGRCASIDAPPCSDERAARP